MPHTFRPTDSYREDTKKTVILVDYSNLLYRAWFVSSGRPWVAYCKFFDMLRLCVRKSKQDGVPVEILFAGESKTKLKRKQIYSLYKGNRKNSTDEKFKSFKEGLVELLTTLGWSIISVKGAEADDVIASIVSKLCHKCNCKTPCVNCDCKTKYDVDVVIFSGDRDLQQCLEWDRTFIYRSPGIFITKEIFEMEYEIPIGKFKIFKALVGDKSDNIKGVDGFGESKSKIAIQANSVEEDIWEMRGHKGIEDYKLALRLVDLDIELDIDVESLFCGAPIIEEDRIKKKYNDKVLNEIKRLNVEFDI